MSSSTKLSASDSKVLASVFDPEASTSRAEVIVDPSLPADHQIQDSTLLAELQAQEKKAIKLLEDYETSISSTRRAKDEVYQDALALLDDVARSSPIYASVLNNRAQLRRWFWGDLSLLVQRRRSENLEQKAAGRFIIEDLQRCIALASPERPTDAASPKQGRLLAQAYTQLGAVYHAAAKDLDALDAGDELAELDSSPAKESLEEDASRFFFLGGLYGNEVAKALAVHTNPQAKLCGQIVKEAMRKELALAR